MDVPLMWSGFTGRGLLVLSYRSRFCLWRGLTGRHGTGCGPGSPPWLAWERIGPLQNRPVRGSCSYISRVKYRGRFPDVRNEMLLFSPWVSCSLRACVAAIFGIRSARPFGLVECGWDFFVLQNVIIVTIRSNDALIAAVTAYVVFAACQSKAIFIIEPILA